MSAVDQPRLSRVLSHPTLKDGITDSWTDVVATLNAAADVNPELIDELLDPDQVSVEERVIDLPLAGKTHLVIVRHTPPGAGRSMDLLEGAVRRLEELMSVPFPDEYVRWLFVDDPEQVLWALSRDPCQQHSGRPDSDDGSFEEASLGSLAGHETGPLLLARGTEGWIGEGRIQRASGALGQHPQRHPHRAGQPALSIRPYPVRPGEGIQPQRGRTFSTATIRWANASSWTCIGILGKRPSSGACAIFTLYHRQGREYSTGQRNSLGIEQVRTAFRRYQQPGTSMVDTIVARWYDGTEPYDASVPDTAPPNPDFLTINGRVVAQRLALTRGGAPVTSISADAVDDWLWLMLSWEYSVSLVNRGATGDCHLLRGTGLSSGENHLILTAYPGGQPWPIDLVVSGRALPA